MYSVGLTSEPDTQITSWVMYGTLESLLLMFVRSVAAISTELVLAPEYVATKKSKYTFRGVKAEAIDTK